MSSNVESPRPRRALIISDPPGAPSGLGGQARILVEAAQAEGYDCRAIGFTVKRDRPLPPPFFDALGQRARPNGALAVSDGPTPAPLSGTCPYYELPAPTSLGELAWCILDWEPDVILALSDLWMVGALERLPDAIVRKVALWVTADGDRFPTEADRLLTRAGMIVTMAKYGEQVFAPLAGKVPMRMIRHAVKPEIARTTGAQLEAGRVELRRVLGRGESFIALHVGRNQYRKMQPLLLEAWARFVRQLRSDTLEDMVAAEGLAAHPPVLFLHTEPVSVPPSELAEGPMRAFVGDFAGWNLPAIIQQHYGDVQDTIRFSERGATDHDLAAMYAMADVFVLSSNGEGFGVPSLEALACGVPAILPDNTTSPEILGVGEDAVVFRHETGAQLRVVSTPAPNVARVGWLVPCPTFTVQGDSLVKRPLVDPEAMSEALRDAWDEAVGDWGIEARRAQRDALRAFVEAQHRGFRWADAVAAWRDVVRVVAGEAAP